ncbi:hypothetical protein GE061_006772 [Apolygus lucorum]|uniref:Uncharacterized protein n=1 Tax=Apolygus lucorum TaxID=248454 RepID=A0A6A4J1J1_APOLU|nr:hypothetical protein GE061_006772 [Apolygus lucorum]
MKRTIVLFAALLLAAALLDAKCLPRHMEFEEGQVGSRHHISKREAVKERWVMNGDVLIDAGGGSEEIRGCVRG